MLHLHFIQHVHCHNFCAPLSVPPLLKSTENSRKPFISSLLIYFRNLFPSFVCRVPIFSPEFTISVRKMIINSIENFCITHI